jgi:hypothetical protein
LNTTDKEEKKANQSYYFLLISITKDLFSSSLFFRIKQQFILIIPMTVSLFEKFDLVTCQIDELIKKLLFITNKLTYSRFF